MEPRRILLLLLAAVVFLSPLPANGEPAVDPALRPLLQRTPSEIRTLLTAASTGGEELPVARSLLLAGSRGPDGLLDLFVSASAPPAGEGITVTPLGGDLYGVRATPEGLRALVTRPGVGEVRLSRPLFPILDHSTNFLGLGRVRRQDPVSGGLSGLTGKGVAVGFVDTGLDYGHPDFRNEDGTTRVSTYWNQRSPNGTPPAEFPFGAEWNATLLNGGILGHPDQDGHGTHVAGIAVGNGRASENGSGQPLYTGVAPEATLIVVDTNFSELGAALGVRYVFLRAAELGMPCVVNLSLGNQFGPHRGTTPLERSLVGNTGPGRIIVAAAGNDGARPFHAELRLAPGEVEELHFRMPSYNKSSNEISYVALEGWFDPAARYDFTVLSPEGEEVGVLHYGDEEVVVPDPRGYVRGWYVADQGLTTLFLDVEDNLQSPRRATGTWGLRIESRSGTETELDFWIVNWFLHESSELPAFADHVDPEETVLSPASAPEILAVGAIATRTCWPSAAGGEACYDTPTAVGEVAPFSAIGPTSDGRDKPEILAPGLGVIAPRSENLAITYYSPEEILRRTTPDGHYWINQGTSMAAPHAAGTVALLLERYPHMTVDQMRQRLLSRSPRVQDPRTGRFVHVLRTGTSVAPVVSLSLSEIRTTGAGIEVDWFTGKELAPLRYEVWKGFDEKGPFFRLASERIQGQNPYEVIDPNPEPGRRNLYRIVALDETGLADELDTLSTFVAGTPEPLLRPPDPSPTQGPVNLRFFAPPSEGRGRYRLDVFDLQGRLVHHLGEGDIDAGGMEAHLQWDLRDDAGRRVPGGLYFVRLEILDSSRSASSSAAVFTRRVVVLP